MNTQTTIQGKSLDTQLAEFRNRRFLATPLAGTIVWSLLILTGALLPPMQAVWAVFIGTGSIIYLALGLAKLTGESMKFQKGSERNFFDSLFLSAFGMCFLVYALVIPFFLQDYRSLPFAVAVLAGLMWLPVSVLLQHWVGVFHALTRTVLCTAAWFIAPEHSFVLQPMIVVAVYLVSIFALEQRWRIISRTETKELDIRVRC